MLVDEKVSVSDGEAIDGLREQVERLDTSDRAHCVSSVRDVLVRLGDVREYSAARFHLLEACRVRLRAVAGAMVTADSASGMPLAAAEFAAVAQLIEALEQLGAEYEVLAGILDQSVDDAVENQAYQEAYCLYRQLELLDDALIVCALVYLPAPALLWSGAHAIVDRAIGLGALDFSPAEALDAPGLGDLYALMLLTVMADPYRMSSRQLVAVRAFIKEVVAGAEFRTPAHYADRDTERRYLFAIDFDLDVAALPWRASGTTGESEFELVLDVSRLVRLARKRQLAIRSDEKIDDPLLDASTGFGLDPRSAQALYKHLVVEWGKQPIRKSRRRADEQVYDCLIGFAAVQQAHRIEFSIPEDGPEEIVLSGGVGDTFSSAETDDLTPTEAGVVHARSTDISATGIRLVISTTANSALRIGELVGWRDPSANSTIWITGLIRWMRSETSETIEVGVLILGRLHDRAALHVIDDGELSRSSTPVIVLKDSPYRGSREWLLTADAVATSGDRLRLVTSDDAREFNALAPALETRHVVCHTVEDRTDEHVAEKSSEPGVAEPA